MEETPKYHKYAVALKSEMSPSSTMAYNQSDLLTNM